MAYHGGGQTGLTKWLGERDWEYWDQQIANDFAAGGPVSLCWRNWNVGRFRQHYDDLPPEVRQRADKRFAVFRDHPFHPSLRLKPIGPFWWVRVSGSRRALAIRKDQFTGLDLRAHPKTFVKLSTCVKSNRYFFPARPDDWRRCWRNPRTPCRGKLRWCAILIRSTAAPCITKWCTAWRAGCAGPGRWSCDLIIAA